MKKVFSLLLAALLCVGLCACGGNADSGKETEPQPSTLPSNIMQKEDPSKDDTLNILMIGSSYCYYYVEELYALLKEAGIESRICNVYYSGCPLEKHWTWWKNGEAHYEFFVVDDNGKRFIKRMGDLSFVL